MGFGLTEDLYPNGIHLLLDYSITIILVFYEIIGATRPYDINNVVPKIKQSDFIKEIMFRHGCCFYL